jgi:hypothetical protein
MNSPNKALKVSPKGNSEGGNWDSNNNGAEWSEINSSLAAPSEWVGTPVSPPKKAASGWEENNRSVSGWGASPTPTPSAAYVPPPSKAEAPTETLKKSTWASIVSKRPVEMTHAPINTALSPAETSFLGVKPPSDILPTPSSKPSKTNLSITNSSGNDSCVLWVRNIGPSSTDNELGSVFEQFGHVTSVYIRPDRSYAFVTFSSQDSISAALSAKENKEEIILEGRSLKYEQKSDARKDGEKNNNRRAPRSIPRNSREVGKAPREADRGLNGDTRNNSRSKGKNSAPKDVKGSKLPPKPASQQQIST